MRNQIIRSVIFAFAAILLSSEVAWSSRCLPHLVAESNRAQHIWQVLRGIKKSYSVPLAKRGETYGEYWKRVNGPSEDILQLAVELKERGVGVTVLRFEDALSSNLRDKGVLIIQDDYLNPEVDNKGRQVSMERNLHFGRVGYIGQFQELVSMYSNGFSFGYHFRLRLADFSTGDFEAEHRLEIKIVPATRMDARNNHFLVIDGL